MHVSEILRRKGGFVATVAPEATVSQLLALLADHNIGAAVVSTGEGPPVGIASERDVARGLTQRGAAVLELPVAEIMTTELSVAGPEDSVDSLMRTMTERRVRHVPVVADGRLAGIISIGDVVKIRMDELESDRQSLIGYISSAG